MDEKERVMERAYNLQIISIESAISDIIHDFDKEYETPMKSISIDLNDFRNYGMLIKVVG